MDTQVAESRASELEAEIASLREAVRHDYSERRRLKAAGEELEDVKKQLASASAVNATLAEGRRELRDALDATSQRLAASEGRNGALEQAASYVAMLERVFEGTTAAESLSPALHKLVGLSCCLLLPFPRPPLVDNLLQPSGLREAERKHVAASFPLHPPFTLILACWQTTGCGARQSDKSERRAGRRGREAQRRCVAEG